MKVTFVTGNAHKLREVRAMLVGFDVMSRTLELPEIQSLDPHEIVRDKVRRAYEICKEPVFVEDVSLICYALGALPGPMIKWFIEDMGAEGLAELVHKYDRRSAKAQCTIGYADKKGRIYIIDGVVNGTIVMPRGASNFGFDPIFLPERQQYTYAQMNTEEKNSISHRGVALAKFRTFLAERGVDF